MQLWCCQVPKTRPISEIPLRIKHIRYRHSSDNSYLGGWVNTKIWYHHTLISGDERLLLEGDVSDRMLKQDSTQLFTKIDPPPSSCSKDQEFCKKSHSTDRIVLMYEYFTIMDCLMMTNECYWLIKSENCRENVIIFTILILILIY